MTATDLPAGTTTTTADAFAPTSERLLPELTLPQQLTLLVRALWQEGYDDHLAGHVTHLLDDGTLLCNPWYLLWEEVRPEHFIRIDLDGRVLEGEWPVPPGIPLHLELHRRRSDVTVALHNHPRWGTIWADRHQVPPIHDQSSALGGGTVVCVDEYAGAVNESSAAAAAVTAMGDADIALLANHGVFVLGRDVRAVHQRAVALEQRARGAWRVEAVGGGHLLPDESQAFFGASDGTTFHGFWEAMARRELRRDPTLLDQRGLDVNSA